MTVETEKTLAVLVERIAHMDEKMDTLVSIHSARTEDHENRLRNLEVFRNWSTGVVAACTGLWAVVKGAGEKIIS